MTIIECGQCGTPFHVAGIGASSGVCANGHGVIVALDIAPNLEDGERIAWIPTRGATGERGWVLGYDSAGY